MTAPQRPASNSDARKRAEAHTAENDALTREERWVPVAESGDRWKGRSREAATSAMAEYPAGGSYTDGAGWDGITHVEREVRYVSEWRVIPPGSAAS